MKRIAFLIVFTILLIVNVNAQKMYIWCPNQLTPSARTEQLKNVEINLLINDNRLITDNSKNKCTSEELMNSLYNLIKATYPSSKIYRIMDGKKKDDAGKVYIEINIKSYHATFSSPKWFAQTSYAVKTLDSRNGTKKENSQDILKEEKFINIGGFGTAKNNLNKTYVEANIELLNFISDKLNY